MGPDTAMIRVARAQRRDVKRGVGKNGPHSFGNLCVKSHLDAAGSYCVARNGPDWVWHICPILLVNQHVRAIHFL